MINFIKIFISKILSFFNFHLNYPGLRFETLSIKKKYKADASSITIICFGDSNTFGWNTRYDSSYPALLEDKIKTSGLKVKVVNCGIGGNTVSDADKRLQEDVLFFKPAFVIISFGFNDARLFKIKRNNKNKNKSNSLYLLDNEYFTLRINKEEFKNKLENIIEKLQKNNIGIILAGLYEVNKIKSGIFYIKRKQLVSLQNKVFKEYDILLKEISSRKNIFFLDLWNKLNNYEKIKSYFQEDGFHLGNEGHRLIADNLFSNIARNCFLK